MQTTTNYPDDPIAAQRERVEDADSRRDAALAKLVLAAEQPETDANVEAYEDASEQYEALREKAVAERRTLIRLVNDIS